MLGLSLIAAFAMSAVATSSALAVKNPTNSVKIFENCPVHGEGGGSPDVSCIFGATELGEGGQFTVGPITVPLAKQIILQYGISQPSEEEFPFIAPTHGAEAITPTPEKVPGEPIAHITPAEQTELGWSETLSFRYRQAQKKGTVKKVYETIEGAGDPATHIFNILREEGTGVEAPVKIKGENKWLSELGDVCYIGSDAEPIVQHLTSGASESPLTHETVHGSHGELTFRFSGEEVILSHSNLVDNTYPVPGAVCTGPFSAQISATINKEFGLPEPAGASLTELKGTLYTGSRKLAEEKGGAS
jgi:hypothetical protein